MHNFVNCLVVCLFGALAPGCRVRYCWCFVRACCSWADGLFRLLLRFCGRRASSQFRSTAGVPKGNFHPAAPEHQQRQQHQQQQPSTELARTTSDVSVQRGHQRRRRRRRRRQPGSTQSSQIPRPPNPDEPHGDNMCASRRTRNPKSAASDAYALRVPPRAVRVWERARVFLVIHKTSNDPKAGN